MISAVREREFRENERKPLNGFVMSATLMSEGAVVSAYWNKVVATNNQCSFARASKFMMIEGSFQAEPVSRVRLIGLQGCLVISPFV